MCVCFVDLKRHIVSEGSIVFWATANDELSCNKLIPFIPSEEFQNFDISEVHAFSLFSNYLIENETICNGNDNCNN